MVTFEGREGLVGYINPIIASSPLVPSPVYPPSLEDPINIGS